MRAQRLTLCLCLLAGLFCVSAACDNYFRGKVEQQIPTIPDGLNGSTDTTAEPFAQGAGVGEACGETENGVVLCRQGLTCVKEECRAVGTSLEGQSCILSDECADGLICDTYGACRATTGGNTGAPCVGAVDCGVGFGCDLRGAIGSCTPAGTGDLGATCTSVGDCLSGLFCGPDSTCETAAPYFGFTPWSGTICPASSSDSEPPRILFEIARTPDTPFFHLPHPNDLRSGTEGVDLEGFPEPGTGLVGVDIVRRLKAAAAEHQRGFSRTATVRFRFSHRVDFDTIQGKADDETGPSLHYVNVDPGSPAYGPVNGFHWSGSIGSGHYYCPDWLTVQTHLYAPLLRDTSYAAYLTDGVRTEDGVLLTQDDEFALMLGDEQPEDPTLAAAWDTYGLLRDYLDSKEVSRDTVIGGAVFTTGSALDLLPGIRAASRGHELDGAPTLALCDEAGPCSAQLESGCPTPEPGFTELHARLSLPQIQEGTPPFTAGDENGGLKLDGEGSPQVTGTDGVCVTIATPAGVTMPDGGWPVLLYGHDHGGNFRSVIEELGSVLWEENEDGPVPVAVIGWQGPLHGDRGTSEQAPLSEALALDNPEAFRGHIYQGAADIFSLVHAIEKLSLPTDSTLNATRLAYMGHGRGATVGLVAVPYETEIQFSIWAGAGADLPTMLLERTSPVSSRDGMALALGEFTNQGPKELKDEHPVVNLLRDYLGPVDPQSYGRALVKSPPEGSTPRHQLQITGLQNSHVSDAAANLLARIIGLTLVPPELAPVSGVSASEGPVSGNAGSEDAPVTAALIQANPVDGEGHFVHFQDPVTRWKLREAIRTWAANGLPVIPDGDEIP